MTVARAGVLRPGDWVHYDDLEHQVVALSGTAVRLRSYGGDEQVVLVTHLIGSAGFEMIDHQPAPQLERSACSIACRQRRWPRRASGNAT